MLLMMVIMKFYKQKELNDNVLIFRYLEIEISVMGSNTSVLILGEHIAV